MFISYRTAITAFWKQCSNFEFPDGGWILDFMQILIGFILLKLTKSCEVC